MSLVEKYIARYNSLHGQKVGVSAINKLLNEIKLVHDPNIKPVQSKLEHAVSEIKRLGASKVKLEVKPLALPQPLKKKPAKKSLGSKSKKTSRDKDLKLSDVYGLEHFTEAETTGLGFTKDGQQKIYDMVTDMIQETMKSDGLFWRLPWKNNKGLLSPGVFARNFKTGTVYNGINYVILNYYAYYKRNLTSPYYLTFKQIEALGGQVKKGSKSLPVFFYNISYFITKPERKSITEEAYKKLSKQEIADKGAIAVPIIQYYNVFNAEHITGIKFPIEYAEPITDSIETAETIVTSMPKRPEITHSNKTEAYYIPATDKIHMPHKNWFTDLPEYYSTLFHEMVHSTGHKSRLDRNLSTDDSDDDYAFEELIAELGASYLCAESGILYFTLKNSSAYLKGWKSKLSEEMRKDNRFFLKAAAKAQAASDFILDVQYEKPETKPVEKSRPPVKREKAAPTARKKSLTGFTSADQVPANVATFRWPTAIGEFLGDMQRYKLEIVIAGETHSSKSELAKQVIAAALEGRETVGLIDWEQGGLESRDTVNSINRNIPVHLRKNLQVSGSVPRNLDAVKALADKFSVVVLDSGSKLKEVTNAWIDELREEYPKTIWIILMQQNEKGGTRGGKSAEFDAPIVIKTYRPNENDHRDNYAYLYKNRGNETGLTYNIFKKEIEGGDVG